MTEETAPSTRHWVEVVVTTPAHSGLGDSLSYGSERPLAPGTLVRVPLGSREVLGIVWHCADEPPEGLLPAQTRPVGTALEALPPLNARWRQLVGFAARYYQRGLGEVALAALPPQLRDLDDTQLQRRLAKRAKAALTGKAASLTGSAAAAQAPDAPVATDAPPTGPAPSPEQADALTAIAQAQRPVLLFGATGSGKTEVYLRTVADLLAQDPQAQALVMVPEINLTPQLEARFRERFASAGVVSLHSGLTPAQRLGHWLSAHLGQARIVLGTRMAVFASLPGLRLIVVDEEHDPSYKSQEGARYSARDLAVYRAHLESQGRAPGHCRVLLGSATPSLESWHAADKGRYQRLDMPQRMGGGALPRLRLVDMNHQPKHAVLAPALIDALAERAARGEQSLVLLNRRGYAPVLACHDCGWKSDCPHCSAHAVFHKIDRTLRCHHCGHTSRVPRACPECGNLDIASVGRGTEQIEEQLAGLLADARRPDGNPVRVARLDADTTRAKGSLESRLADMHAGEVDVLVGTQMVAKGHDFRRITLVASLNTDSGLFASDYRAPERLFALLLQAAGRAGRDAAFVAERGSAVELWVQTWYPQHPLFAALARHDYPAFAAQQLQERADAQMPPHGHQALVRAEARTQDAAQAWLTLSAQAADGLTGREHLMLYPAVPMAIQRVANVERAQMLVESASRPALQAFLQAWQTVLHAQRAHPDAKGLIRWAIDVDPLSL
ncbi:primosomal protein N' [Aquabacterium sp. A08]|uniref:replication restart helicase PriA n=1 Tax=Aquabacterium sp. A08 TaxID=2718532 RepID=UPI00141D9628|nr:primosomal protein N' [Aquabacterium sp. A08]NIC43011.1 primosomal protein N' [Aquabacterium sp. A08]